MIQITEEQARKMLIGECGDLSYGRLEQIINGWKEKGYIKKSALEECIEYVNARFYILREDKTCTEQHDFQIEGYSQIKKYLEKIMKELSVKST